MLVGTISDLDQGGRFGLIAADDGGFLPFNLRDMSSPLRGRLEIGVRVRFEKRALGPTLRAVDISPLDECGDDGTRGGSRPEI
jgi:hypothetical protein